MLVCVISFFFVGSWLCALARSMVQLAVARAIAGLGGGGLMCMARYVNKMETDQCNGSRLIVCLQCGYSRFGAHPEARPISVLCQHGHDSEFNKADKRKWKANAYL